MHSLIWKKQLKNARFLEWSIFRGIEIIVFVKRFGDDSEIVENVDTHEHQYQENTGELGFDDSVAQYVSQGGWVEDHKLDCQVLVVDVAVVV